MLRMRERLGRSWDTHVSTERTFHACVPVSYQYCCSYRYSTVLSFNFQAPLGTL